MLENCKKFIMAGSVRDWGNMREGKGKKRYSCERCNTAKH